MNNNGSNNELSGNEIGFVDILKVIFKYKYFINTFYTFNKFNFI